MKNSTLSFINVLLILTLMGCSGADPGAPDNPGDNGNNNGATSASACGDFGGSINDNAGVTYSCVDAAGALYEMKFDGNGGFVWHFITTGDTPVPNGQYSVAGDQVRLVIPGFDVGATDFDETSTVAIVKLGMLAAFRTPRLACGAIRHDFDLNTLARADYSCQPIPIGPGVVHYPVFRLAGLSATPNSPLTNQAQPGNAFWSTQKDIVTSISNEDFEGIYRQVGNKVCMYFPGAPADRQEVEADLAADLSTLTIDRPEFTGLGSCGRI